MATAMDVARYLLQLAGRGDEPELMTQKRLYKLLYYVQGWNLAWYGRPMFAEPIEAWREGPVPPTLYSQFKLFGPFAIPATEEPQNLTSTESEVIEHVWRHYRQWSAAGLSAMTHTEPPWKDAYQREDGDGRCSNVISLDAMKAYFGDEYQKETGEPVGYAAKVESDIAAGRTVPHDKMVKQLGW